MDHSEHPRPDRGPADLHRRTWELELLISGAILVGLLQLPSAVDRVWEGLRPHVSRDLFRVLWYLYFPLKLTLMPTIGIFLFHVLVRGFWVGLVGLNAVFPGGIRWERLDFGPVQHQFYRERVECTTLEERADRLASVLFSLLFSLLAITVAIAGWCFLGISATVLARSLGADLSLEAAGALGYFGSLAIVVAPGLASSLLDRWILRHGPGAGRLARLARVGVAIYWKATLAFVWYPPIAVLTSNLTRRKMVWWKGALYGLPIGILLPFFVLVPLVAPQVVDELDSYVRIPDAPAEAGSVSSRYENRRGPEAPIDGPLLSSDVPEGSWLRIFLPYDAWRDGDRLRDVCPEVEPFRRDGDVFAAWKGASGDPDQRAATLTCFARLWTLELDGEPLEPLDLVFADVAGPGSRATVGVATFLDLRSLPTGPHQLVASRRPSAKERERDRFDPAEHVFHLPFRR